MKAAISAGDGNNVIRFDFTQKEFSALEWEGRSEFTFKGEMYDVVRKEKVGESIVVWCMDDKSETALVNNYLKFHRPLSEKNTSAALLKFLTLQFQSPALIEVNQSVTLHLFSFPPYVSGLSSAERFILVPPPKCC